MVIASGSSTQSSMWVLIYSTGKTFYHLYQKESIDVFFLMIKNNYYGTNYGKANIMVSIRQKKKKTIVYCMLSKIMIHEREIFWVKSAIPIGPPAQQIWALSSKSSQPKKSQLSQGVHYTKVLGPNFSF